MKFLDWGASIAAGGSSPTPHFLAKRHAHASPALSCTSALLLVQLTDHLSLVDLPQPKSERQP